MIDLSALSGLRVLVVGLGREGAALAQFLVDHGLPVTATDQKPVEKLGDVPAKLAEAGVSLALGSHPDSLLDKADLLFVSPGVPLEISFLEQARQRGLPLSTESRLFCHLCPVPIVAITGSSGKTTTTTLVGEILEAAGYKTWVGGNIGRPLISIVEQIAPDDIVVMELSSFQLEYFHARLNQNVDIAALPTRTQRGLQTLLDSWSPPIAAVLNITPNHLDRHPSMKHYVGAKRALIDYQKKNDVLVMGLDNDMTRTIGHQFRNRVRWFSLEARMPGGAGLQNDTLAFFDSDGHPTPIAETHEIPLRGQHNLSNVLAACLLAREAGGSIAAMRSVVTRFKGVEHRLQHVRELDQVVFFDDSISTTPERVIAALRSFNEPVILLAGGRDKHLSWAEAARLIHVTTRHAILFGEAADVIESALRLVETEMPGTRPEIHHCSNMAEAVELAATVAKPGDVVLLSPGCASFDQFGSYAERGQKFSELVMQL